MDPLIITATPNICWLNSDVAYPKTMDEIVQEAKDCEQAGATIYHIHGEGRWTEVIDTLRAETNMVVQLGMSSLLIPDRMDVFKAHGDMISIITNHHDEAFLEIDFHVLHPREELEEYAALSRQYGVRLEFEIWNSGSIWNLNYLIDKGLVTAPYFTTNFYGWPGGSWTPPTFEEYLYRRSLMPEGCVVNTSVMGKEQKKLLVFAILNGDHVRVGTEDYPYLVSGKVASTAELVDEIANIAVSLGRTIAKCSTTKKMLNLE